jgi:hypothetical protein
MTEYQLPETQEIISGVQYVFLTMAQAEHDGWVSTLNRWFAGRDEVHMTDFGTTDKQELSFIVMEWDGYAVDKLFLAILDEDEDIEDYTVYTQSEDDE